MEKKEKVYWIFTLEISHFSFAVDSFRSLKRGVRVNDVGTFNKARDQAPWQLCSEEAKYSSVEKR
jgi:hypothetical protein